MSSVVDGSVGSGGATAPGPISSARLPRAVSVTVVVPVRDDRAVAEANLRRLLSLAHPSLGAVQLLVVDDGSADGTREIVARLAARDPRVTLHVHPRPLGRGAAIRTALPDVHHEVTILLDLDVDPPVGEVLAAIAQDGADAVFGSRYATDPRRPVLSFQQRLVDRSITWIADWLTGLDLSDVTSGLLAVRTALLRSIPLRSDDDLVDVELVSKLAKRRARVFEVPVRRARHARPRPLRAVGSLVRHWAVDDVFASDAWGSNILLAMDRTRRFNRWMADALRPWIGDRVIELGAGMGTLTHQFVPRQRYVATDINPDYLLYLRSLTWDRPYLEVAHVDATCAADFAGWDACFDTALMCNVLEHVPDPIATLENLYRVLEPGGRAVVLVPQHPWLYGSLDAALDHRERYTPELLRAQAEAAGFTVEALFDFNRFSVPGWWLNGRVLNRRTFSRAQLAVVDALVPAMRRLDPQLPWSGQSVIVVARKPR